MAIQLRRKIPNMGVYQENFDGYVGASWSEFDLLHPFKRKNVKTKKKQRIPKTLLDVFLTFSFKRMQ